MLRWPLAGAALLPCALMVGSLLAAIPASAEIVRVVVEESGPTGIFGGRNYTWVKAQLEGIVQRVDGSIGAYRVPISLEYPDRDANGFGFVDVVNNADYIRYSDQTAGLGRPTVIYSGDLIFSDFLKRQGFTYLSVQWNYPAADALGESYAVIERPTDGYEIIKDAALLLRQLGDRLDGLATMPPSTSWVIGHGQSQSAQILRGFVWRGDNRNDDGTLSFDGFINTGHNGQGCRVLVDEAGTWNPERFVTAPFFQTVNDCVALPDHGKFITLRTQSEIERTGNRIGADDNQRWYDIAGVAHVPDFLALLRYVGANRQNPVSWRPVAKALLLYLVDWIENGEAPPPSILIEGRYDQSGSFSLALDEDGNALGGIRLPHMPIQLPNGDLAGAPLGVYSGIDWDLDRQGSVAAGFGYASIGGTFTPFSDEDIARRYPSRETYVELVSKAASHLLENGLILVEDYEAYVRAAEAEPRLSYLDQN